MKVKRIMSSSLITVKPNDSIKEAVIKMHKYNIGFIIVQNEDGIVGVLTDRDALLSLVSGYTLDSEVNRICIKKVITVRQSQNIEDASELMGYYQIKRLVVLNDENIACGVITLRDIALKNEVEDLALDALQEISFGPNTKQFIIQYDNNLHDL